jgi:predicted molibdopterin-dependent oxidoreductase YjgC
VYNIYQHAQDKKWKEKNATIRAIDSVAKCQEGTAEACIRGQYGILFIKNDHRRKKPLADFGDF